MRSRVKSISLSNYIVGRRQVIEMFQRLDQAYPQAQHIYLVMDVDPFPS